MAVSTTFAEDELGRKWDKCLTDVVLKMGGGLAVGTVMSLLFFKRRSWPVILGSGFGIGMAYANCERSINSTVCEPTPKPARKEVMAAIFHHNQLTSIWHKFVVKNFS